MTLVAPITSRRRIYVLPAFVMPLNRSLPPLEFCRGTSPSHAANWRPFLILPNSVSSRRKGAARSTNGKRVWVLVWDNAAWHVSQAVRAWIGMHNQTVKRTGGFRILVRRLPVKSPWLNPIEPRWLHGKRAIFDREGPSTAHELMYRVHQHFGCEPLHPFHQHVF